MNLKNIIIIGSGVMGGGIAEQFANADIKVHLLDIVPLQAEDRNILAKNAIQKILSNLPKAEKYIIPGNIEDDCTVISEADWIIEVIIEKIDFKHQLYRKLESICKDEVIISSNTSTIELKHLINGMTENFKQNFLITHFFDPPRYMQLVEIVVSEFTNSEIVEKVTSFIDFSLGKTTIRSYDTPGFIANRIGCYWLQLALNVAISQKISIEEADYLMSRPIGIPKTGVFGLYDLIGIDVMQLIVKSLTESLPENDEFSFLKTNFPILTKMIGGGYIGRKGKGGFYKIQNDNRGNKHKQVIDFNTGEYREIKHIDFTYKNILEVINNSEFAKIVLVRTLNYAINLLGEVSDSFVDIDMAIKLGYNWKFGPFEMVDQIGIENFKKLLQEQKLPISPKLLNLKINRFYSDNSPHRKVIFQNESCVVHDVDDGVAAIEIISKMGILTEEVFQAILEFFSQYQNSFKAVLIMSEGDNFSVGANLKYLLENAADVNKISAYLDLGKQAMLRIKYSPIPVVGVLKGLALGGGCEVLLHSHALVAHVEANIGLVETNLGLIPGWGGVKEALLNHLNKHERIEIFKNILTAKIFNTPESIVKNLKFKNYHKIMNPNRLILEAKKIAIELSVNYKAPIKQSIKEIDINWNKVINEMNLADEKQEVANILAKIFSSKECSEEEIMQKEQEYFLALFRNESSLYKIKAMLKF